MRDLISNALSLPSMPARQSVRSLASDVHALNIIFVNVCFVGEKGGPWVMIDAGMPYSAPRIRRVAQELYGAGARPEAILLTHGHFDHVGAALELAREWKVRLYCHRMECPYLTGKSAYPPPDPTVGGAMAFMSRFFPRHSYDFRDVLESFAEDGTVPHLRDWRLIHTPGHTAGHISLFRDADGVLIAGDAFTTLNQENPVTVVTQTPELRWPPCYFTSDWNAAIHSIHTLAGLHPRALITGHGEPLFGDDLGDVLHRFAHDLTPPPHGRYVKSPAVTDALGVVSIPPAPPDPFRYMAMGALIAGAGLAAWMGVRSGNRKNAEAEIPEETARR